MKGKLVPIPGVWKVSWHSWCLILILFRYPCKLHPVTPDAIQPQQSSDGVHELIPGDTLSTVTCLHSILLLWSSAKMRLRYNKNHHNNIGVSICHQLAGAHTYARQLSKLGSLVCGTYHLGIWGVISGQWNSQSESQPWNSTGRMLKSWDVKSGSPKGSHANPSQTTCRPTAGSQITDSDRPGFEVWAYYLHVWHMQHSWFNRNPSWSFSENRQDWLSPNKQF